MGRLKKRVPELCQEADDFETAQVKRLVESFTVELFQGEVRVEESGDPEIDGLRYFVVFTTAAGTHEDVRRRCRDWHTRLEQLPIDMRRLFRLSVDVI